MRDRTAQLLIIALLGVVGFYFAQPYIDRMLYSASTPRTVAPRGNLADIERTSIELFERVSPSVVQVVAHAGKLDAMPDPDQDGQDQSGTGFIWDGAGHIVTNDHVVHGTDQVAVRLSHRARAAGAHRRHRAELRSRGAARRRHPRLAAAGRDRDSPTI